MAALLPLLAACQSMSPSGPKASATLEPTKGSTIRGNAGARSACAVIRAT